MCLIKTQSYGLKTKNDIPASSMLKLCGRKNNLTLSNISESVQVIRKHQEGDTEEHVGLYQHPSLQIWTRFFVVLRRGDVSPDSSMYTLLSRDVHSGNAVMNESVSGSRNLK